MSQDAKEVTADADAKWFSFRLDAKSFIVLEKKTAPEHLATLDCLDVPTAVDSVLRELEDAGEAPWFYCYTV